MPGGIGELCGLVSVRSIGSYLLGLWRHPGFDVENRAQKVGLFMLSPDRRIRRRAGQQRAAQ